MKSYYVGLAGESKYQRAVKALGEGDAVDLVAEPENKFDPRAIRVDSSDGETVGYIPRDSWLTQAIIDQGVDCFAVVKEVTGERKRGVVITVWLGDDAAAARTGHRQRPKGCGLVLAFLLAGAAVGLGSGAVKAQGAPWDLSPARIEDSARASCAADWPADFSMRAFCARQHREGAARFAAIAARYSGNRDMTDALAGCFSDWTENGVTDYSMLGFCAEQQEKGWREVQGR